MTYMNNRQKKHRFGTVSNNSLGGLNPIADFTTGRSKTVGLVLVLLCGLLQQVLFGDLLRCAFGPIEHCYKAKADLFACRLLTCVVLLISSLIGFSSRCHEVGRNLSCH